MEKVKEETPTYIAFEVPAEVEAAICASAELLSLRWKKEEDTLTVYRDALDSLDFARACMKLGKASAPACGRAHER